MNFFKESHCWIEFSKTEILMQILRTYLTSKCQKWREYGLTVAKATCCCFPEEKHPCRGNKNWFARPSPNIESKNVTLYVFRSGLLTMRVNASFQIFANRARYEMFVDKQKWGIIEQCLLVLRHRYVTCARSDVTSSRLARASVSRNHGALLCLMWKEFEFSVQPFLFQFAHHQEFP